MSLPATVDDLSSLSHEDIRTFYFFTGDSTRIQLLEALIRGEKDTALQIYRECLQRMQDFAQGFQRK